MMTSKVYDNVKWIAQIFLPAFGALYFGLGDIWNLPKVSEVVGTVTVFDTFLGLLLGISLRQYNQSDDRFDGRIEVEHGRASINVEGDPQEVLETKPELLLQVKNQDVEPKKSAPRKRVKKDNLAT